MIKTEEIDKFYYFFPQTVAVIGVEKNVMPAAWHTPISAKPPLVGILVAPKRHTYTLLKKEKEFTINFMGFEYSAMIAKIGGTSGRDLDKLKKFKIEFHSAEKVKGIVLSDSYAAYECEKFAVEKFGDHFLVIGKIVLLHYRDGILTSEHLVDEKKVSPMLYFGKDRYVTISPHSLSIHKRG
jgi:flavin reductase (DIM6/NTAB) family NADH-FMN oxidoreductase RutF